MMVLIKSRNTMVFSAVIFLVVVVLLRLTGGLFEDNIVRVVGSIFGGNAEDIPLIDFGSLNLSWLNPTTWSMEDTMSGFNEWLHETIDSVLPGIIHTLNLSTIHILAVVRTNAVGATALAVKLKAI